MAEAHEAPAEEPEKASAEPNAEDATASQTGPGSQYQAFLVMEELHGALVSFSMSRDRHS